MNSIPMSTIIGTIPSTNTPPGNSLSLNMTMLTQDPSIPIGRGQSFPNLPAVESWFGAEAPESILAGKYFPGNVGASGSPSALWFFQYNIAAVAAYERGGPLLGGAAGLTALQGLNGTVIATIDGRTITSANINLAAATSFSNAAALIQTGLETTGNTFTGQASLSGSVMTVTATTTGRLHVGDLPVGTGITGGTSILSFGNYDPTTGVGTVNLSAAATTESSEAITVTYLPTVTFDALRQAMVITSPTTGVNSLVNFAAGTIATGLKLTSATGAVLSQGAAATTPTPALNALIASTTNFASFMTVWEADVDTALGFANWVSTVNAAGPDRFLYAEWDSNAAETVGSAPDSFGAQVTALEYDGSVPIYDTTAGQKAAFLGGLLASINFNVPNARLTAAFKKQAGLAPDITDATSAANLAGTPYGSGGNGYNFYGAFGTATTNFNWFMPGSMPGDWKWIDPYWNQIAMGQDFILALATLEDNSPSLPYTTPGNTLIRSTIAPTVQKYLTFGAIRAGVPLSATQAAEVDSEAGVTISTVLSTLGWYLQILPATAEVRGIRGSPPMKFWYTDGGSIQSLMLATVDVQ